MDILINFSNLPPGTKLILQNDANQPYPGGDPVDPNTTGQVMRFEVLNTFPVHPKALPAKLIDIPTVVETEGIGNPKLFTLNEQESATGDIDVDRFKAYWEILNGATLPLNHPTIKANVETLVFDPATGTVHDFLTGPSEPPSPRESGWKDTFVAPPGKVTRVLLRFAPQYAKNADLVPGKNPFPFDPTAGPGYVWHCHILDHEDNDMMRPMKMVAQPLVKAVPSKQLPQTTAPTTVKPGHVHAGTKGMMRFRK